MSHPHKLALLAGLLIAAGLPPWGWWPLSLIGVGIWFRLTEGQSSRNRRRLSFLVGLGWTVPPTLWMADFSPAGWPVAVLVFSALAAVAGWLTPPEGRWLRHLAFPAAVTVVELVRWNYPFGGTPIATFAMIGVSSPWWGAARLFGSPFLTGIFISAGAAAAALFDRDWRRPAITWIGLWLVALISLPIGNLAVETTGRIDVAVVQGGGPQNTRADICANRAVFERHMEASATIDRDVDLVLWPEDVVHPAPNQATTPARCNEELLTFAEASSRLAQLAFDLDSVVVSGWFERTEDGLANANYAIAQSPDGTITDRYDKVRLVPFGEFVPLRSFIENFSDELPPRDVRAGTKQATLDTEVGKLGVSISWEVFFDHRARDAIGNGGQLLLNPTNGSSYWLTIVQSQQIASSRLRAVETGRTVLQAAPTGFSAIIDSDGEVRQRTGVSEQKVLYGTVEMRTGRTTAVALGAWPMLTYSIVALAAAWLVQRRRNASLKSPPTESPDRR